VTDRFLPPGLTHDEAVAWLKLAGTVLYLGFMVVCVHILAIHYLPDEQEGDEE
jgi:hypothetical protein